MSKFVEICRILTKNSSKTEKEFVKKLSNQFVSLTFWLSNRNSSHLSAAPPCAVAPALGNSASAVNAPPASASSASAVEPTLLADFIRRLTNLIRHVDIHFPSSFDLKL